MPQQPRTSDIHAIPRGLQLALCVTALAWAGASAAIASRGAEGIASRFSLPGLTPVLDAGFLLFLVVVGVRALDWVAAQGAGAAEVLPLPRRSTSGAEWGMGAAMGWGLALVCVLPPLLTGHLHAHLAIRMVSLVPVLLALLALLAATLAEEAIFRGYAFRRLADAIGPTAAACVLSAGFALTLISANPPHSILLALINGTLLGLLLTMTWMRTHALWLGWGLHFAFRAVTAVVLGLPIAGRNDFGALTDSWTSGPRWLGGGAYGLDAALLTVPFLLVAMIVLYRATRDYAWQYTQPELVAAGYEVTVAPPAAHVAMERAAAPPPLVQIAPVAPPPPIPRRPDEDFS